MSEGSKWKYTRLCAYGCFSGNHDMADQAGASTQFNFAANMAEWTDLDAVAQLCAGLDDSRAVNGNLGDIENPL